MKIALVSSECVPFAKTGGLADVIGALPKALRTIRRNDVRVFMPFYSTIDQEVFNIRLIYKDLELKVGGDTKSFNIYKGTIKRKIPVYFIDNSEYFKRSGIYDVKAEAYHDNAERFVFFSRVVLEALKVIEFKPDIIHANDWQTGFIPVYLKTLYKQDKFFKKVRTVFTIHNMEYQGIYNKSVIEFAGVPWKEFTMQRLEFYDNVNFLKAGIVYSDIVTTVSEKYSHEIQLNSTFGRGLEGVLANRYNVLFGILNGIDYDEWNPAKDRAVIKKFSAFRLKGKSVCKQDLKRICGFKGPEDIPIVAVVARLVEHKGFDIIRSSFDTLMKHNIQFVLLGIGDSSYNMFFHDMFMKYPGKVSINLRFDDELAHKIYAGADMLLMPSKFEPCGLSQLIAFKYGTVPIVSDVGGLSDTVTNYKLRSGRGSGFVLKGYSGKALIHAVRRALRLYKQKSKWTRLVKYIMKLDFSWEKSAKQYIKIYKLARKS